MLLAQVTNHPFARGQLVGRGGQALVYSAMRDGVRFALKVPHENQPQSSERVREEGRILSRLAHPHLVRLQAFDENAPWLALEWLDAGPKRLSLNTLTAVAEALTALHAHGVVHADLSPKNVMRRGKTAVLIDLGSSVQRSADEREVLQPAVPLATIGYASPEQVRGERLDVSSDLYSFGCMLYESVYKRPLFSASDPRAIAQQHLRVTPTFDAGPRLAIRELLHALLAKDPQHRPASAQMILDVLRNRGKVPLRTASRAIPFVGRKSAMQALVDAQKSSLVGKTQMIVVQGEGGMGKTRLLNEVAQQWTREGVDVIALSCSLGSSSVEPLSAFSPLLRRLQDAGFGEGLAGAFDTSQGGDMAAPMRAGHAASVLSHALSRAVHRPTVIIVDDLHWADELTPFVFLAEAWRESRLRLLFVLASRVTEMPVVLARATFERISLSPLSKNEVAAIARARGETSSDAAALLWSRSEGNPFLVGGYLRAWQSGDDLPSAVAGLVAERLQRVPASCVDALFALAVTGVRCGRAFLDALVPGAVLDAAVSEGLIEVAKEEVFFVHDKWREATIEHMSESVRRGWHARIADLLLSENRDDDATIGRHLLEGGREGEARAHLVRAAEALTRAHLPTRVSEVCARVLSLLSGADKRRVAELQGDALTRLSRFTEAREAYLIALEDSEATPLVRARLLRKTSATYGRVFEFEQAQKYLLPAFEAILPLGQETEVVYERVELDIERGLQLYFLRDHSDAMDAGHERVERFGTAEQRARNSPFALAHLLGKHRYAFIPGARSAYERGLHDAIETGNPATIASSQFGLGFVLMLPGARDLPAAGACFLDAKKGAIDVSDIGLISRASVYAALAARRLRDAKACEELLIPALEYSERAGLPQYVAIHHACRAWLALREGKMAEASEWVTRTEVLFASIAHVFPFQWVSSMVKLVLAEDEPQALAECARAMLHPLQQLLEPELSAALQALAVDGLSFREASEHARRALRLAVQCAYV
jgi:Protein kinase domain/AAA ATPase domain